MSEILKNRMLVDIASRAAGTGLAPSVYEQLMTGSSADMMLESVTIDEIDQTYLGDELLSQQRDAMFEAITTERLRLAQTMRAFVRSLNRGLNGTGIAAGTDDAGADTEGQTTVGGAVIGKVRRVASIPVMSALIPLSDGQSVSLVFHSPTADNGKIRNQDTLVAFQFLINKRDVTHIVAPIGGRDVSLLQVSQALANLIEKNSGKFVKQKASQAKLKAEVDATQSEADQLAEQQSTLLAQIDEQQARVHDRQDGEQALRSKLASQREINADLSARLAALQQAKANEPISTDTFSDRTIQVKAQLNMHGSATLSNGATVSYSTSDVNGELQGKVVIIEPGGATFEMLSPSSQGAKMADTATKMLKAYRTGKAEKYLVTTAQPQPDTPPVSAESEEQAAQPAKPDKRTFTARAGEVPKGEYNERNGRVMMSVEGSADFIRYAEKLLDERWDSAQVEEEGKHEGEIGLFYIVDRGDKSAFMDHWKQIKKDWANGAALPETQPAEPGAAQSETQPEQQPTGEAAGAAWRYALVNRPAGIGAVPTGFTELQDQPARGQPYSTVARNGVIVYDRPLTDKEIADYELKLLPTHADLDALASAVVTNRMGQYAAEYLEMVADDPDMFAKQVKMFAGKESTAIAYPEGDDLSYFLQAVQASLQGAAGAGASAGPAIDYGKMTGTQIKELLTGLTPLMQAFDGDALQFISTYLASDAPQLGDLPDDLKAFFTAGDAISTGKTREYVITQFNAVKDEADKPAPAPTTEATSEPVDPFEQAAQKLGAQVGWSSDLVSAWADAKGYDSNQLSQAAGYVAEHSSPEYLAAVEQAMITGQRIPLIEELANTGEQQQAQPQNESEPQREADTEAGKAIDYLRGLTSLQTDDMDVIRDGRNQVRGAIAALTAAGAFEENEALVNDAVQHLSDLLVAVQRKGAAA